MTISLNQAGKRYQHHWIFKGIDYTFETGKRYAILGANGSGKSTLLRIIGGMQHLNQGSIAYNNGKEQVAAEKIFQHISYCAPGMDLIEEMSLQEFLHFHFTFKKLVPAVTVDGILAALNMQQVRNKFIHEFSSGMKQRVKLAQAFFSDTAILLLDEPCSNLDIQGVQLYQQWLDTCTPNRLVIIASNDTREYAGADDTLSVEDFSPQPR